MKWKTNIFLNQKQKRLKKICNKEFNTDEFNIDENDKNDFSVDENEKNEFSADENNKNEFSADENDTDALRLYDKVKDHCHYT